MKKEEFERYSFSINTEVKYQGNWSKITEVWFREGKIGVKETGHLVSYSEIERIRN